MMCIFRSCFYSSLCSFFIKSIEKFRRNVKDTFAEIWFWNGNVQNDEKKYRFSFVEQIIYVKNINMHAVFKECLFVWMLAWSDILLHSYKVKNYPFTPTKVNWCYYFFKKEITWTKKSLYLFVCVCVKFCSYCFACVLSFWNRKYSSMHAK